MTSGTHAPAKTDTRLPRLESLTGLRWIAAFAVFLHHSTNFAPLPQPIPKSLAFGTTGVTFFFVLSGFVLTWSHFQGDTPRRFYWRRFARIWPLHFVATLLAIPVFYAALPEAGQTWVKPYDWGVILLTVVLLHAWSPTTTTYFGGNPASWSLSCEMFFYAIFPFLARPALRRRIRFLGLIFILIAVTMWIPWLIVRMGFTAGHPNLPPLLVLSPLGRAFEFLLGMVLAAAIRRGFRCPIGPRTAAGILLAVLGGLVFWNLHPQWWELARPTSVMNQVTAPFYALLIAAVATRDIKGGKSVLRSAPMVALGQWSYAFYLVHATVLYAARDFFGQQLHGYANVFWAVAALVPAIALSAVLYKVVEHPLERKLRGMLKRPPKRIEAVPEQETLDQIDEQPAHPHPRPAEPAAAAGKPSESSEPAGPGEPGEPGSDQRRTDAEAPASSAATTA